MDKKEAYNALADLIFKGFLTLELDISGRMLLFKTINEKEYDLVKLYSGKERKTSGYQIRFNTYFLVFSLFLADNDIVVEDRGKKINELYDFFSRIPVSLFSVIMEKLNELRTVSFGVFKYLEGFSYTDFSRNAWKSLQGRPPNCTESTGIPGSSDLGMNNHQESWVLINSYLDFEESYNKDFNLSLLIASASNSKGTRQIRNQHEVTSKSSEDRRKKLAENGFIDVKDWTPEGWAAPVDTVEELVAELDRQMAGKRDKHDMFIDKYISDIKEEAQRRTRDAEERIRRAGEGRENVWIDGSQRALTQEETKKLLSRNYSSVTTVGSEENVAKEDQEKFYKKIGARILTPARK